MLMDSLEGDERNKKLTVNGHELAIAFQRNKNYARWTRSVYVGNLNWNAEEWHIDEFLGDCGEILNIRFNRDQ